MQIFLRHRFFIIAFVSTIFLGYSQQTFKLKKGIVVDSLLIPDTNNYYSIYLPKSFSTENQWPIVFGLDSKRKATSLARLYREAAEEYQYITVFSNVLSHQKSKEKNAFLKILMDHIFSLFPIQKDRVYVTGIGYRK